MSNPQSAIRNPQSENGGSIAENAAAPQAKRLWPYVVVSAALMTAAFPPLDLGFIAWVGLAPLLYALLNARRPRHAFALGYLFGYLHWGLTVTWIGTTVVVWSGTHWGWIAWILLVAIKSLWFGLFGLLAWWIGRRSDGIGRILGLAAAWAVIEWLRGQTMVAMPWSLIGYTQYRYLPIIQAADVGGIYFVSFAIVLVNAGIVEGAQAFRRTGVRGAGTVALVPAAVLIGMVAYGGFRLGQDYPGEAFRLSLMQPNEVSARYAPKSEAEGLVKYRRMADSVTSERPNVMIWPESTVEQAVDDADSRRTFSEIARKTGAYQVVGTGFVDETGASHNSAALFSPSGELTARYDKHWLVPFGEWVPLRAYLPFGSVFGFPERDLVPGESDSLLEAGPARMSVLICYESVFPILSRVRTAAGANLLVSITNDSWAGESAELMQHHAMTALRAVETRRYVASAATTGITALIDPTGKSVPILPYREGFLVTEARLCTGFSLYVRWGDWFVLVCGILVILGLAGMPRKNALNYPQL